jgi:hypothetical protein
VARVSFGMELPYKIVPPHLDLSVCTLGDGRNDK